MIRHPLISILTVWKTDNTIFDDFVVPEGVDKDLVVDSIMLELSELSLIYSDPDTVKYMLGRWSRKQLPVWEKLYKTTQLEYTVTGNYWKTGSDHNLTTRDLKSTDNENRDLQSDATQTRNLQTTNLETRDLKDSNVQTRDLAGTEDETRNLQGTNNEVRNLKDVKAENGNSNGLEHHTGTDSLKHGVWAFNSLEMQPSTQDDTVYGHQINTDNTNTLDSTIDYTGTDNFTTSDTGTINRDSTDSGTVNDEGTDTGTVSRDGTDTGTIKLNSSDTGTVNKNGTDTGTIDDNRTYHEEGNTGSKSIQELIEMEREIDKFNIVDFIVEQFKLRFCLLVW